MKKAPVTTVAAGKSSLPPAQGKTFNAASYVRPGVTEAEIVDIKTAFDLFDTDQGGSIDTNCNYPSLFRTQSCHGLARLREQERRYLPNDLGLGRGWKQAD